jgi:hypothetical protein
MAMLLRSLGVWVMDSLVRIDLESDTMLLSICLLVSLVDGSAANNEVIIRVEYGLKGMEIEGLLHVEGQASLVGVPRKAGEGLRSPKQIMELRP